MSIADALPGWLSGRGRFRRFRKRYQIINHVLKRRRGRRYLEIGVSKGRCFRRIRCPEKIGVDPKPKSIEPEWDIRQVTSDQFFASDSSRFDVVFIDGLHLAEQVLRDIYNSVSRLNPRGIVLLHDCNPKSERAQLRDVRLAQEGWNGDVWKAIAFVRKHEPRLLCQVLSVDQGIGVVVPRDFSDIPKLTGELEDSAAAFFGTLTWEELQADRESLLGLIELEVEALEGLIRRSGMRQLLPDAS